MDERTIGFIGAGVMGKSMAGHLVAAGYRVQVHSRTRAKAEALLEQGAVWAESPAEAAEGATMVVTMVGYPEDVEECYFGAKGIFTNVESGALLLDMTTSSPLLARKIDAHGRELGVSCLDAPVSGGDIGARDATLSIMVGGEEVAYQRALPILECLGKNIVWQGEAGAGQHTKMCNQITNAAGMLGVAESLAYASKAGLDMEKVLQSISSGAAGSWALSNLAPRALKGDYAPGFYVKHYLKDMRIALASAEEMNLSLPALTLAKRLYDDLSADGGGDDGTHAIVRHYLEGKV